MISSFRMIQSNQQLRIIAQPKALYRARYGSEQHRKGNRVQRYIRAEDNQLALQYPTVEVRKSIKMLISINLDKKNLEKNSLVFFLN